MTAGAATVPLAIPGDHPAYAGHFPGTPVLPGVVLLDAALTAAHAHGLLPAGAFRIASAKFFRFVTPGTPLVLTQRLTEGGGVEFEIAAGDERVASGRFVPVSG